MKAFGRYFSKYFLSFFALILLLISFNLLAFVWTFHKAVAEDYGSLSPQHMVEKVSAASGPEGIAEDMKARLHDSQIWAMFLDDAGLCLWSVDLPSGIPTRYSVPDVAEFVKGYLMDYPVFVRSRRDGLLVLGYPKESFMKITGNYFSLDMVRRLPVFFSAMLSLDLAVLFLAYFFSKRKIIRLTEPIIAGIMSLSDGKPVSLSISGDLSELADHVNRASRTLSRQNQARANWISGVSHDIRTPLSMILGYAGKIAGDRTAGDHIRKQAEIIKGQSIKIKDLVQDLNLVSQLEYEMQPVRKESLRLSRLLRTYAAELLSTETSGLYPVEMQISSSAETTALDGDARLITRAVSNLVQNSIRHNPQGCKITLKLDRTDQALLLTVQDNGVGLSKEKQKELRERPHYMESTDERLDLRHGLGLLLVRQIMNAHGGAVKIESEEQKGYAAVLIFELE